MKTEPTEALNEIKHCTWTAEDFNINDGLESHEVVDEDDAINIANIAFKEAMRWRDPKVEPPINQDIVLVKTDNDCYATAYFHGKASGFICYGDDAYIEFGDIIGWRPIE